MKLSNWIEQISRGDAVQLTSPISWLNRYRADFAACVRLARDGGGKFNKAWCLVIAGRCAVIAATAVNGKPSRYDWAWREVFHMARQLGLPAGAIISMAYNVDEIATYFYPLHQLEIAMSILEKHGKI